MRYPQRYDYEAGGTLGGARGTYRCAGDDTTAPTCTVQNKGSHFVFAGPWTFRPSSSGSRVRIEDSVFMYFGWWSRQATPTPAWSFDAFHGPLVHRATDVSGVTGSATYRGPAAGYYAIYEPNSAGSEYGAFTATAELEANFDTNMVQGTIDGFSDHPNWSLVLERGAISGGNTGQGTNGVTWTINNTPAQAGDEWEASFYSNLDSVDRENDIVPSGIAGTFSASYDDIGQLTGAFGAHCVSTVCRR